MELEFIILFPKDKNGQNLKVGCNVVFGCGRQVSKVFYFIQYSEFLIYNWTIYISLHGFFFLKFEIVCFEATV